MPSETAAARRARLARQQEQYPELGVAALDEVFGVDRALRSKGAQPTTVGRAVETTYMEEGADTFYGGPIRQTPQNPRVDVDLSRYGDGAFASLTDVEAAPSPTGRPGLRGMFRDLLDSGPGEMVGALGEMVGALGEGVGQALGLDRANFSTTGGRGPQTSPFSQLAGLGATADRLTGASTLRGIALNPSDPLEGARSAWMNPEQAQLRNLGGIRSLPDNDIIGSLSLRDIAGGAADVLADPGVIAGARPAVRLGTKVARGLGDDALGLAETISRESYRDFSAAITRAAQQPIDSSTRGILDLAPGEAAARLVRPSTRQEPIDKLITLIRDAEPQREIAEAARSAERGRRSGLAQQVISGEGGTERAFTQARGELAGALPDAPTFTAPRPQMGQADIDMLFGQIDAHQGFYGKPLTKISTAEALTKALDGKVPTRSELRDLQSVFGNNFVEAIMSHRSTGAKARDTLLEIIGLPRTVMASIDVSAPLRQGAVFIRRPEWWSNWRTSIKALVNEDYAQGVENAIRSGPRAERRELFGLGLSELGSPVSKLTAREEGFMSNLAERIPIIGEGFRASQRAYVTFLNKLRADVFDNFATKVDQMVATGKITPTQRDQELSAMARWVNIATGRGDLPKRVADSDLMALSNHLFFSPRLAISRIQTFDQAGRVVAGKGITPQVRREAAKDLVTYLGTGTGVIGLLNQAGVWDIDLDPRSSDFAKGRVGPIRYDPWGGFQQYVRFGSQFLTGDGKTTTTGIVNDVSRIELIQRFIRSKLNPGVPALVVDMYTGQTFVGEEMGFEDWGDVGQEVKNRMIPLSIADVIEAYEASGVMAGLAAVVPAALGLGIVAFRNVGDAQEETAAEMFSVLPDGRRVPTAEDMPIGTRPARFNELNAGERKQVNASESVQEMLDDAARNLGSPQQQVAAVFDNWDRVGQLSEATLRASIDSGMRGEMLRNAISDFKNRRFEVGDALFNNPNIEEELLRTDQPIEDILAERYWSAESPVDPFTGRADFAYRDRVRAEILNEAAALDVPITYITGSGDGSYRGKRFKDDVVRQAIEDVEETSKFLSDTGFFSIYDKSWAAVQRSFPGLDQYPSYTAWYATQQNNLADKFIAQGMPEGRAMQEADRAMSQHPTTKALNDLNSMLRSEWALSTYPRDPDMVDKAIYYGYYTPVEDVRSAIDSFPRQ